MKDVLAYIDTNRARFVEELAEWVKIPADLERPGARADMVKNAEHLMRELAPLGADRVELWPTKGHPAVFAEWLQAPGKPTLLVYGHHDVQPVDPLERVGLAAVRARRSARGACGGAASSTTRARSTSTPRRSSRSSRRAASSPST